MPSLPVIGFGFYSKERGEKPGSIFKNGAVYKESCGRSSFLPLMRLALELECSRKILPLALPSRQTVMTPVAYKGEIFKAGRFQIIVTQ